MSATRVPAAEAWAVAERLLEFLTPHCEMITVAGSLRRRKPMVKDIEILFVPTIGKEKDPGDLLEIERPVYLTERAIAALLETNVLAKRPNIKGSPAWGEKNKLGVHVASGIAVDLFTASISNWFNYLVCRTGGEQSNIRICNAARARGWKWNPYGVGFSRGKEIHAVKSEAEVFKFVGLAYQEPWQRK